MCWCLLYYSLEFSVFENVQIKSLQEKNVTESQYTDTKFHLSSFASHIKKHQPVEHRGPARENMG